MKLSQRTGHLKLSEWLPKTDWPNFSIIKQNLDFMQMQLFVEESERKTS